jgi:hypothetical protein
MNVTSAAIIGRSHRLRQQNNQDVALCVQPTADTTIGLVLDGCGSGARSEVGANLLGQFTLNWLCEELRSGQPVSACLEKLGPATLIYLDNLTQLTTKQTAADNPPFIAAHLLTTLVGFIVTPEEAAFFWRGDGYLCQDGRIERLEADNQPDYLAYDLLNGGDGRLHSRPINLEPAPQWLAVASDGWREDDLAALAAPRADLELTRWLNQLAQQRDHFDDDGAVAVMTNDERPTTNLRPSSLVVGHPLGESHDA